METVLNTNKISEHSTNALMNGIKRRVSSFKPSLSTGNFPGMRVLMKRKKSGHAKSL